MQTRSTWYWRRWWCGRVTTATACRNTRDQCSDRDRAGTMRSHLEQEGRTAARIQMGATNILVPISAVSTWSRYVLGSGAYDDQKALRRATRARVFFS